jgi:hypothetical protein
MTRGTRSKGYNVNEGNQGARRIDLMFFGVDSSLRCLELNRKADKRVSADDSSGTLGVVWINLMEVFIYGMGTSKGLMRTTDLYMHPI